jgi:hypothetical protein
MSRRPPSGEKYPLIAWSTFHTLCLLKYFLGDRDLLATDAIIPTPMEHEINDEPP